MDWQQKTLSYLSLSDLEIRILESLKTAQNLVEIAEITKIPRTSVAYNLKGLVKRKIVTQVKFGKRYRYIALTPEQFIQKLQETIDETQIKNDAKKGARIKTTPKDEFIIHVGAREIIPAFTRIAFENKNERVKAIQHHRSFNDQVKVASPELIAQFNDSIIKNHIIVDGILNEGAYKSYFEEMKADPQRMKEIKSLEGRMSDYSVFPDDRFNYDAEIWIFKTTTAIINWKEKVAIEITNENMTGFLKEMFEYVKHSSKKIDHNKMMREMFGEK